MSANVVPSIDSDVWASQLNANLRRFLTRARIIDIASVGLVAFAAWMGLVFLTMVLDVFFEYSATLRWILTRATALMTVIAIAIVSWLLIRKHSVGQLALKIDAVNRTGGEITTAWDLVRSGRSNGSTLTSRFTRQAIARSSRLLEGIEPASVLPANVILKPCYAIVSLLGLGLLCLTVSPSLANTQFKRFAFPFIETLPYSGFFIEVEPANLQLKYGDDAKIIALASRKPTERMELVTISPDGHERILPMLPRGESKWQALLTNITAPAEYFAKSGRTRSASGKLEVQLTPQIKECLVRVTPPEYTRQAVYEGKIPEAGIAGIEHTRVEFVVTSNRPLTHGKLVIELDDRSVETIELRPSDSDAAKPEEVRGEVVIKRDGKFSITITDIDGLESTSSVQGKFLLLTDQKPVVRIVEPKPLSLATPDINMPIVISAEDDFGITQLRLYRSLNGSPTRTLDLPVDGMARINATVMLPLPTYGLSPGDEIQLFARTEDNDPRGPKGAESPKTIIRIISVAEFQERMLEQRGAEAMAAKYEAAQRHLENVATAIEELEAVAERAAADPENEALQKELQEKMQAAQKAAEQAAAEIEKLSENPMDIDIDRELVKLLKEMAHETKEQAEQLGAMAENQAGNRPLDQDEMNELNEMREQIQGMRDEIQEEAIDPLNELTKSLPLMQDQQRFEELVERQKELAERMQSLADTDPNDPSNERRMMELEAAQDEVRQELNDLAESLDANADQLPATEEFSDLAAAAKELSQKIKQSGAPELMNDAQKSLLRSKFGQAAEMAKAAAEALGDLSPQNESMGDMAEENAKGAFQKPGEKGKSGRKGKPGQNGQPADGEGDGQSKLGRSLEQLKQRMNRGRGKQSGDGAQGEPGGPNNGFSQRSSRPQNMGMYGSMPSPSQSSRGRSDKVSQGAATRSEISKQDSGKGSANDTQTSDASGQSQQNIPSQYRQRVFEYYRRINEQLKPE